MEAGKHNSAMLSGPDQVHYYKGQQYPVHTDYWGRRYIQVVYSQFGHTRRHYLSPA